MHSWRHPAAHKRGKASVLAVLGVTLGACKATVSAPCARAGGRHQAARKRGARWRALCNPELIG